MGSCLSKDEPEEHAYPPTKTSLTDDDSSVIAVGECRICFDKQISADDPVVQLGCSCMGEISCAHESCIRKWFPTHSVHTGAIACEICKEKLGEQARSIVNNEIRSKVWQYLLRRGLAQVGQTIGRIIITLTAGVQAFNDAVEVGIWECFH